MRDVLGRPWAVVPKEQEQSGLTLSLDHLPAGNYYLQFFQEGRLLGVSFIQKID